jgi:hypothetical protein
MTKEQQRAELHYIIWQIGYEVLKGNRLIDMKLVLRFQFGSETDFTTKTIDNCLAKNEKKFYEVFVGKRLIEFKLVSTDIFGKKTDFPTKTVRNMKLLTC